MLSKATNKCFNSQPPEGGWIRNHMRLINALLFQLTAARRRLGVDTGMPFNPYLVSTHSRPKAAGRLLAYRHYLHKVSTHSRPKAAGHTTAARPAAL